MRVEYNNLYTHFIFTTFLYSEPTEYPPHILEAKLKTEARIDIFLKEVEVLQKKLSEIKEAEDEIIDGECLAFGLRAEGKFFGTRAPTEDLMNVLRSIDGQRTALTKDNLLIINDTRSPYNGMSVASYRALCNVWKAEGKKMERERLKTSSQYAYHTNPLTGKKTRIGNSGDNFVTDKELIVGGFEQDLGNGEGEGVGWESIGGAI